MSIEVWFHMDSYRRNACRETLRKKRLGKISCRINGLIKAIYLVSLAIYFAITGVFSSAFDATIAQLSKSIDAKYFRVVYKWTYSNFRIIKDNRGKELR